MIALAAAVLIAAAAVADGTSGTTRRASVFGATAEVPPAWHVGRSDGALRITISEVTIANFAPSPAVKREVGHNFGSLELLEPTDATGEFPATGVAFRAVVQAGGSRPRYDAPESRFPLRVADFRPQAHHDDAPADLRERAVVGNGRSFRAQIWVGFRASARARAALAGLVASVRFPRLRRGQRVGVFTVLDSTRKYVVGSVSRVRVERQPFYLVRAPGGFYAVRALQCVVYTLQCRLSCTVRFDARPFEFTCPTRATRWNRLGRVIARPGRAPRERLHLTLAKRSWDGHVLLAPSESASEPERLWPGWRR